MEPNGWSGGVVFRKADGACAGVTAEAYVPYRPPTDNTSSSTDAAPGAASASGAPAEDDNEDEEQAEEAPAPRAVHAINPEEEAAEDSNGSDSASSSESEEDFDPQLYPSITTGSSRHVPPPPQAFSDADSEESSASGSDSEYAVQDNAPDEGEYTTYVTKTGRIKIRGKAPTRASARIRVSPGAPTDIVPLAVRSKAAVPSTSTRGPGQASAASARTSTDSPSNSRSQSPASTSQAQPTASSSTAASLPTTGKVRKAGRKPKAALMAAENAQSTGIQGWDGPAPAAAPKTGIRKVTLSLKAIAPAPATSDGTPGTSETAKKRLPRKRRYKQGATSAEIITAEMDEESEVEAATVNGEAGTAATAAAKAGKAEKGAKRTKKDKGEKGERKEKGEKGDQPRKKRKTSDVDGSSRRTSIAKTPKGTRPPPLSSLDKKEPSVPRLDRGLISPVVTGFPVHTADGDTLDSLRTAWKIKEQQRLLINARKNGDTTPAMSPGMGPPISGQPFGQPAPTGGDGRQVLPPTAANGSVGQRRGDVAREKVNNLRLNTAGSDPAQMNALAMRSAPIGQMPMAADAMPMQSSINGYNQPQHGAEHVAMDHSMPGMSDQQTVAPLQAQPLHANPAGATSSGSTAHQLNPDTRTGAMTAYPSLGSQTQYQQQQSMMPPTSTAPSSQMPAANGRRASAISLSASSSSGQMRPPSSSRPDKGVAGPLLTHAPFMGGAMVPGQKDIVMQPLQVQPARPQGLSSYAPGDPTPMQAHFGPGRSPPSSTIRRDFGPTGRDWQGFPTAGGLHPAQAGPSQQRMPSNGDISGLPGGSRQYFHPNGAHDAHRSAFMEPFHVFYDALMDSSQLRAELKVRVAKATELVAAQEHELGRIKAVREELEVLLVEARARDATIEDMKHQLEKLERRQLGDDASSSSSSSSSSAAGESEKDGSGEPDVNMA